MNIMLDQEAITDDFWLDDEKFMLNSEHTGTISVDSDTFQKLLAILDNPPEPTPALVALMQKYGGLNA